MSRREVLEKRKQGEMGDEFVIEVVSTTRYHVKIPLEDVKQTECQGGVSSQLLLQANPEVILGRGPLHAFLEQLMEGLPDLQRTIVLCCCRDGRSEADVAKELGLTVSKVRSLKKGALREAKKKK